MVLEKPYVFETWIYVELAGDVPTQWVAHCIANDVVSVGDSVAHAIAMAGEACAMTLMNDLASGRDPLARSVLTPPKLREKVNALIDSGETMPLEEATKQMSEGHIVCLALSVSFHVSKVEKPAAKPLPKPLPRKRAMVADHELCAASG